MQIVDKMGNPRWITADLIESSKSGIRISVMIPVEVGTNIVVRGNLGLGRVNVSLPATIKSCEERADRTFRAGLEISED